MVHMTRSAPPSLVAEALGIFDLDIRRCFTECTSVDVSVVAWQQAQLRPSRGGLGLRSLLHHSSACFIASIGHSGIAIGENHHLEQSIDEFNGFIADTEAICLQDILDAPPRQRHLSSKIEDHQLKVLFDHPLSVLSPCLGLAFGNAKSPAELTPIESPEFQVALNGGLEWTPSSQNSSSSFCPSHALDPMGHHALTCNGGGDSIIRHNSLRDTFGCS